MKKLLIFFTLLLVVQLANAQNITFTDGVFDNGLVYPIADRLPNGGDKEALNNSIMEIVSDYKNEDYCISQYGFVQHNNFVQMNFYFNCIDLDESITELHLFDIADGETCLPSEMIADDRTKDFQRFFQKSIVDYYTEHNVPVPESEYLNGLSIDDCSVVFNKLGLEISLESREDWPEEFLLLSWSDLGQYLKHLKTR